MVCSPLLPVHRFCLFAAVCPGGYTCGAATTAPTPCLAGTYCMPGSTASVPCDAGTFCPPVSPRPLLCPAGSYCNANASAPTLCPERRYCPAGSSVPLLCPLGFRTLTDVSNTSRAAMDHACARCLPGTYSEVGAVTTCERDAMAYSLSSEWGGGTWGKGGS